MFALLLTLTTAIVLLVRGNAAFARRQAVALTLQRRNPPLPPFPPMPTRPTSLPSVARGSPVATRADDTPSPLAELPRFGRIAPGERIELVLEDDVAMPEARDILFETSGEDVLVRVKGHPCLIVEDTAPAELTRNLFRFCRDHSDLLP